VRKAVLAPPVIVVAMTVLPYSLKELWARGPYLAVFWLASTALVMLLSLLLVRSGS